MAAAPSQLCAVLTVIYFVSQRVAGQGRRIRTRLGWLVPRQVPAEHGPKTASMYNSSFLHQNLQVLRIAVPAADLQYQPG